MSEFKPHDYFMVNSDGYISREVFKEHVRKTYDQIRELADYIKKYEGTIDTVFTNIVNHVNEHVNLLTDLYNDLLDNNVLDSEIQAKLTQLEQDYAPRLNDLTAQLQQTEQELNAQLADKAKQLDVNLKGASLHYGEITIPDDFAKVPFNLWRDRDGLIKHDYDLEQYDVGNITVYVNDSASNDSRDGLSEENAVRSIWKALEIAESRPEQNIVIKIMDGGFFTRERSFGVTELNFVNKRITISTFDKTKKFYIGSGDVLVWSKTEGRTNVYQASRSNASGILDLSKLNQDYNGIPRPYKKVDSIDECDATEGSWFTENRILYTHTIGSVQPDNNNIFGLVRTEGWKFKLNNSTLVVKNACLYNGGAFDGIKVTGDINSKFILDNVKSFHNNYFNAYTTVGNGIASIDVGQTLLFNVTTAYGNRDGFNYHYGGIPIADRRKCLAVEYNCMAYDYGVNDLDNTNDNATTMHEGACVLRVGTIGYRTRGPVLADVNASYSINYDVHMRDSLAPTTSNRGKNKVAMKFHTGGATISEVGKAILVNCSGGGDINWGIYREGDVDTEFTIQGFKGASMVNVTNLKVLN